MMKLILLLLSLACAATSFDAVAEVQVINGKKYECADGVCRLVEDDASTKTVPTGGSRMAQGYMSADDFIAFLEGRASAEEGRLARAGGWLMLLLVLLGGLAMNLTPCVLPMIPVNLIVIGCSAKRGAAYGLGIALAYGALGVAAAFGGLAFGTIQGSPWFNAAVALVFVGLSLALFDVWFIDLSRFRPSIKQSNNRQLSDSQSPNPSIRQSVNRALLPFFLGALSAVLAGACVAPILISVLLLTVDLAAKGNRLAVLLPFVMGVGMALPWPFVGAGLRVLPKPGMWMKNVNRVFGVVVLGFAAWYGWLAWQGFSGKARDSSPSRLESATPETLEARLAELPRPVLVDCWATWCKNCAAMDRVLDEEKVRRALQPFAVLRVQAEDISELRRVKGFEAIRGLPAFVLFE